MSDRKFFLSIRMKILLGFLILILFTIALGWISYHQAAQALSESYTTSMSETMTSTASYMELMMSTLESRASELVQNETIAKYLNGQYKNDSGNEYSVRKKIEDELKSTVNSEQIITDINIFGSYGESIAATSRTEKIGEDMYDTYMSSEDITSRLAVGTKFLWNGYHSDVDTVLGQSGEDYGLALTVTTNRQDGFILVDMGESDISSQLSNLCLNDQCYVGLITRDGKQISSGTQDLQKALTENQITSWQEGEEGAFVENLELSNQEYMCVHQKISDTGILIYSLVPQSVILEKINNIKTVTLFITLISVAAAILVALILASSMGNAIGKINKVLEEAANGNLTKALSIKRKDEFGHLAVSVNHMFDGMKSLICDTGSAGSSIKNSAQSVSDVSQELLDTASHIEKAINDIDAGLLEQTSESEICLKNMEELSQKIMEVEQVVPQLEELFKMTDGEIKMGTDSVGELKNKSIGTNQFTGEVTTGVNNLAVRAQQISGIVAAINSIASQTNLLALNASIEAARAGEQGRGFSVVAEEIKKLADQSMTEAGNIESIIESIQQETNEIVQTSAKAQASVEEETNTLVRTIEIFRQISQRVKQTTEYVTSITDKISSMQEVRVATLNAITNIAAVSEETAACNDMVKETAQIQLDSAKKLSMSSDEMQTNVVKLRQSIKEFKI